MWTKREVVIFFAGVETLHTFAHHERGVSGQLPTPMTLGEVAFYCRIGGLKGRTCGA